MFILGISCFYHDSAACLVQDGEIVAAAEEERFSRKKHDADFPIEAIKYCLKSQKININDLEAIVFYEKPFLKLERIIYQHLHSFPQSLPLFLNSIPLFFKKKLRIKTLIRQELKYQGKIMFCFHHLSHAASTFFPSPFKKAAILTVDGLGEWTTTSLSVGQGNKITPFKQIKFPHSLGLLYSTLTAFLGFKVNNSEFKVMGLAPYGQPRFKNEFEQLIKLKKDGSFALDLSYFSFINTLEMFNKKLIKLLGPPRKKDEPILKRHQDLAASLQFTTEKAIFNLLNQLYRETKITNLCLAGGVALNSVANGKILSKTPFKKIYIQPAASDAGGSLGAALYAANCLYRLPRNKFKTSLLGPGFSSRQIKEFLTKNQVVYHHFPDRNYLINKTAKLIFNNQIVAWFQGKLEWGPRALGNRSILANPGHPKMKDILNKRVKHREPFRPFAPVVCFEDVPKFFACDLPLPEPAEYMLLVYPIKKDKQKLIPAVTHVDGSGRLQAIKRNKNPLYYDLVQAFGKLSGVPVLINTSFNVKGEPIVCTPQDAYNCLLKTGIDVLVIDEFLIFKKDNV